MKLSKCIFIILLFIINYSPAQTCNTCTVASIPNDTMVIYILKSDTSAYIVNLGQTFCISSTGNFKGTIVNNGGTICNKGRFSPKSFVLNSGHLANYKNMSIKNNITLGSSSSLYTDPQSISNLEGDLVLSGGLLSNEGLINSKGGLQNSSGSFLNKGIINCTVLTGNNAIQSYKIGLINIKN